MKKICMFHANFCGISSRTCGAGTYSINQLHALDKFNESTNDYIVIPYWVSLDYADYVTDGSHIPVVNNDILANTKNICKKWKGETILISDENSSKVESFWAIDKFALYSELTANVIVKKIVKNHNSFDKIVIVANDLLYASLPKVIYEKVELIDRDNIILNKLEQLWIPHSTGKNYQNAGFKSIDNSNNISDLRILLEEESIKNAEKCNYKIGAIGESFAEHLCSDYGLNPRWMKILYSGIFRDKFLENFTQKDINLELSKRNIPIDKDYIFCIGQGISHKGHDIAIRAFATLIKEKNMPNLHLVILAPEKKSQDIDHTVRLESLIKKLKISSCVTLISSWDSYLAKYMYSHKQTLMTFLPVKESPEDLIPMECRTNPKSAILLTSNIGSNRYQINDNVDGFLFDIIPYRKNLTLKEIESSTKEDLYIKNDILLEKMENIISLDEEKRSQIIANGIRKIDLRYDVVKNFEVNFLKENRL